MPLEHLIGNAARVVEVAGVAVLLLGEPLTLWHTVGLAAVLGGTWLGTWRRP